MMNRSQCTSHRGTADGRPPMSEEFKNRLLVHAKTAVERAGRAQNEEATKQFLIIPFLQLLGYDPPRPRRCDTRGGRLVLGQVQEPSRLRDMQGKRPRNRC